MKTVKLLSSTLLRGHKSINLSVLNSKKVAFVMHESQKVASNLFMIRSFIFHFWSVFIISFWVGQINCVWGSLHVFATGVVFLSWSVFFSDTVYIWITHVVFQTNDRLDWHYHCIRFLEIQSNNVSVDDKPQCQDVF